MTIITKNIGRLPVNLGDYDSTRAYGRKNRCLQYGCEVESLVENNTDAPFTWDGSETFTLNPNWRLISGNPEVWAAGNPKPAASEDYPYNGMGRVVIPKNMVNVAEQGDPENIVNLLTQAAFEDSDNNPITNTVFVIQYDFTLGEDITVPANCVLEFEGGSINGAANCALTLNNCGIIGNPRIFSALAGSYTKRIDLKWFISDSENDVATRVNHVCTVCKNIYWSYGSYIITGGITIDSPLFVDIRCKLTYQGASNVNLSALKIIRAYMCDIFVYGVYSSGLDYTEATGKIIGVEFTDIYYCFVKVMQVWGFNEGIRISADALNSILPENSYNKYFFLNIQDCNKMLRIYQINGGCCNENEITGGSFRPNSEFVNAYPTKAIVIAGDKYEGGTLDTYDTVNSLHIHKISCENFKNNNIVYARNIDYSEILLIRTEGCTGIPFKLVGNCLENEFSTSYYADFSFDLTECLYIPFKQSNMLPVKLYSIYGDSVKDAANGLVLVEDADASSPSYTISTSYNASRGAGFVIDTSALKMFILKTSFDTSVYIAYLEDTEGNKIKPSDCQNMPNPGGMNPYQYYFNMGIYMWGANGQEKRFDVKIPDNVSKIWIGSIYAESTIGIYTYKGELPKIIYDYQ